MDRSGVNAVSPAVGLNGFYVAFAYLFERFELAPKINGLSWLVREQHETQIFNNYISIVIGFQEPIVFIQVILVKIFKSCLRFCP